MVYVIGATLIYLFFLVVITPPIYELARKKIWPRSQDIHASLKKLFHSNRYGILSIEPDTGQWLTVNIQLSHRLGYTPDELLQIPLYKLFPTGGLAQWSQALQQLQQEQDSFLRHETQLKHHDGTPLWFRFTLIAEKDRSHTRELHAIVEEITEEKYADYLLQQTAAIFDHTLDGVMITDTQHRICRINQSLCNAVGYNDSLLIGKKPNFLLGIQHSSSFFNFWTEELELHGAWQGEIWLQSHQGESIPFLCNANTIRDKQGKIVYFISIYTNISKQKANEAQLQFLAYHDPLTRLPNRAQMLQSLMLEIRQQKDEPEPALALLSIDLDRFKDINDCFGHASGDTILQSVSQRLQLHMDSNQMLCRLGSDEFALMVTQFSSLIEINQIAEGLLRLIRFPFHLSNRQEILLSASIGIGLYPEHGTTAEALLQTADAAMYKAKSNGQDTYVYYSQALTSQAKARLSAEIILRKALDKHQLKIFFQPQFSLKNQQLIGAEALVRIQDPERGLISPNEFIMVAEESGLIRNIDEWMLQAACRQGAEWIHKGLKPLLIAVNISPAEFLYGHLFEIVQNTLKTSGFPASCLELELTERTLMSHENTSIELLHLLREQGIRLAIDDFGTGYSSLSYLKNFPLDVLKIDKSFVDGIPNDDSGKQIASSIVAIAHALHLEVVAEGVENQDQLNFLRQEGCDSYQGYYTSKPVPAAEFERRFLQPTAVQLH